MLDVARRSSPYDRDADTAVAALASFLRRHAEPITDAIGEMKIAYFLSACSQAGASCRESGHGGSWVVRGRNSKSIRISRSTNKVDGNVVRAWLKKLGISETTAGISASEFRQGVDPEQEILRQFRKVLRRLAHV